MEQRQPWLPRLLGMAERDVRQQKIEIRKTNLECPLESTKPKNGWEREALDPNSVASPVEKATMCLAISYLSEKRAEKPPASFPDPDPSQRPRPVRRRNVAVSVFSEWVATARVVCRGPLTGDKNPRDKVRAVATLYSEWRGAMKVGQQPASSRQYCSLVK